MQRLLVLLLLSTVIFTGCTSKKDARLYIYCNETFWYVMQEESLFFNKIYGSQVYLIPLRAERTADKTESPAEIGIDRRSPIPWLNMTADETVPDTTRTAPIRTAQINPDIERQIRRIFETHFGDLFLSDSPKHLEAVRNTALSAKEYPVCYLTLSMLVPSGNPLQFRSVKDVLDTNHILGIVDPSFDGLGEASWQVLRKIVPGGESDIPMHLVRVFERQYDLMEALELGRIDAALVWNSTSQVSFLLTKYSEEYNTANEKIIREADRSKDTERLRAVLQAMYQDLVETQRFAEEVELTENPDERHITAIWLVALSSSDNHGHCKRFADFMRSNQGKEILRRFGFVVD